MKSQQSTLGLSSLLCLALGACSAHASFGAGSHSAHHGGAVASSAQPPRAEPPASRRWLSHRGHGNDADGVDQDNPGKSKKKK
jgi:hypothetical protein